MRLFQAHENINITPFVLRISYIRAKNSNLFYAKSILKYLPVFLQCFDGLEEGNLTKTLNGEPVGTIIYKK